MNQLEVGIFLVILGQTIQQILSRHESREILSENRKQTSYLEDLDKRGRTIPNGYIMEIYTQTDPRWSGLHIGNSPYTMGADGCLTTAVAQAFLMTGYTGITPDVLCKNTNLYTPEGDWKWYATGNVYPYFHVHFQSTVGKYQFIPVIGTFTHPNGTTFKSQHWLLRVNGTYYDPAYGNTGLKSSYVLSGTPSSADIDTNQNLVTITTASEILSPSYQVFSPFYEDLEPSQVYSDEVKRVQSFLSAHGFFTDAGTQDGYYGPKTQDAVHAFQQANGIKVTSEYGWWYPLTRSKANQQLTISNQSL